MLYNVQHIPRITRHFCSFRLDMLHFMQYSLWKPEKGAENVVLCAVLCRLDSLWGGENGGRPQVRRRYAPRT
ncbi:hypothetical protein PAE9249_00556 [Paenibacillus sp. CECT 9249]|nr:hypothetical protein PAE9249_00556 [Paenibacillus sp. CECT 9249]